MSPEDPRHGTEAGYQAHKRDREKACRPCTDAAVAARARRDGRRLIDEAALTGGRWIPSGGIMRWQPEMDVAS